MFLRTSRDRQVTGDTEHQTARRHYFNFEFENDPERQRAPRVTTGSTLTN